MISISHWGLNPFHDEQYVKVAVRHHEAPAWLEFLHELE